MRREKKFGKSILLATILMASIIVPVVYAGNDDGNNREIGIEWVNDYSALPGFSSPPNTDDCARSFYNTLGNNGFTRSFDYGNSSAQERHWEKSSVGGQDNSYVETVDFVYFAGHGDTDEFWFGVNTDGDGSYTYRVHHSEALWGNVDLEWVFLKACEVLKESGQADWHAVYDNIGADLHGICGFHSTAYDTPNLGSTFAQYLLQSYSINAAWRLATSTNQHQFGNVWGAIQARELINVYTGIPFLFYGNETMPGFGSGMYNDPSYYGAGQFYKTWYYERWLC